MARRYGTRPVPLVFPAWGRLGRVAHHAGALLYVVDDQACGLMQWLGARRAVGDGALPTTPARVGEGGESAGVEALGKNVGMSSASRFVDRLAANRPYEGVVALAYDAWMPPGARFPDDALHAEVVRSARGPSLELGVGSGRFLVPLVQEGQHLEGIDISPDMLDRCRRNAAAQGLEVLLHCGDIAPLALGQLYGALVCPAGSFSLIDEKGRAFAALASYLEHLEHGGTLAISMFVPGPDDLTGFNWRLRRTGTDQDGTTYVVHEATGEDSEPQVHLVYNRLETYDAAGVLSGTHLRKHRLRWWTQGQFNDALNAAGFVDVGALGDEHEWVAVGRRP